MRGAFVGQRERAGCERREVYRRLEQFGQLWHVALPLRLPPTLPIHFLRSAHQRRIQQRRSRDRRGQRGRRGGGGGCSCELVVSVRERARAACIWQKSVSCDSDHSQEHCTGKTTSYIFKAIIVFSNSKLHTISSKRAPSKLFLELCVFSEVAEYTLAFLSS